MNIERITKPAFAVIGMEGEVRGQDGTVQHLWAEANSRFGEVEHLAKRNGDGSFAGFWGAMSDFSRSFMPWEKDFSCGLYLAGVECEKDAQPPCGWTKWLVPAFEYLRVRCEENIFNRMLDYISESGMELAGAVQDFTDPSDGENYMLFPVKKL